MEEVKGGVLFTESKGVCVERGCSCNHRSSDRLAFDGLVQDQKRAKLIQESIQREWWRP